MRSHESYRSGLPLEPGQKGHSYLATGSRYDNRLKTHRLVPLVRTAAKYQ
jgi:hypothetical protein